MKEPRMCENQNLLLQHKFNFMLDSDDSGGRARKFPHVQLVLYLNSITQVK